MRLFLPFALLLILHNASSQGFVVTVQKDTLRGEIEFISSKNFDEVVVKNEEGKQQLKVYQIAHVQVGEDSYKPIVFDSRQRFAKVNASGKLNYYLIREEAGYEFAVKLLLKETGEGLLVPSLLRFKKQVANFIAECETLSQQVSNSVYKPSDLETIVKLYNDDCGSEAANLTLNLEDLSELIQKVTQLRKQGNPIPDDVKESLQRYLNADVRLMLKELIEEVER